MPLPGCCTGPWCLPLPGDRRDQSELTLHRDGWRAPLPYALWSPADRWHRKRSDRGFRLVAYRLRDAVRGEDENCAVRHFANLLDKNRTALAQAVDHVAVVHHFVTHVNRRAVNLQRVFNNADSAVYTGAKPRGLANRICISGLQCRIDLQHFYIKMDSAPGKRMVEVNGNRVAVDFADHAAFRCRP